MTYSSRKNTNADCCFYAGNPLYSCINILLGNYLLSQYELSGFISRNPECFLVKRILLYRLKQMEGDRLTYFYAIDVEA